MKVKVVLFASARESFGGGEVELELSQSATVADLKRELIERCPEASELVIRSAISIDHEFAVDSMLVDPDCEIGLIPPVSGG